MARRSARDLMFSVEFSNDGLDWKMMRIRPFLTERKAERYRVNNVGYSHSRVVPVLVTRVAPPR